MLVALGQNIRDGWTEGTFKEFLETILNHQYSNDFCFTVGVGEPHPNSIKEEIHCTP